MSTLKTGCSAYYDSFAGLVPVEVLAVTAPATPPGFDLAYGNARASIEVKAKVTEDFSAYKAGELLTGNSLSIVPRSAIRQRQYSSVIEGYDVIPDAPSQAVVAQQQPMF